MRALQVVARARDFGMLNLVDRLPLLDQFWRKLHALAPAAQMSQVVIAVAAAARLLLLGYCPAVAVPTVIVRVCVCVPLDFAPH